MSHISNVTGGAAQPVNPEIKGGYGWYAKTSLWGPRSITIIDSKGKSDTKTNFDFIIKTLKGQIDYIQTQKDSNKKTDNINIVNANIQNLTAKEKNTRNPISTFLHKNLPWLFPNMYEKRDQQIKDLQSQVQNLQSESTKSKQTDKKLEKLVGDDSDNKIDKNAAALDKISLGLKIKPVLSENDKDEKVKSLENQLGGLPRIEGSFDLDSVQDKEQVKREEERDKIIAEIKLLKPDWEDKSVKTPTISNVNFEYDEKITPSFISTKNEPTKKAPFEKEENYVDLD